MLKKSGKILCIHVCVCVRVCVCVCAADDLHMSEQHI
jgi:hypothetical protein